ncbi:MAG: hypothetical protein J2P25_03720 [Nocardiopsaceae bacterium]|nr:hypothetical protein [Nocardiopsaceae bacterium]
MPRRYSRREILGAAAGTTLAIGTAGVVAGTSLRNPWIPDPADAAAADMGAAHGTAADATAGAAADAPGSTFFSTAFTEYYGTLATSSDGDLWANCWADDGNMYGANGDGKGFGDGAEADVVVSKITGTPETGISGQRLAAGADVANVWGDTSQYNRKPTGMACADGVLYLAVQDLRYSPSADAFNDAPNASISMSTDHGTTWTKTSSPMFTNGTFTTIFFLDFGQNGANAVPALGSDDGQYIYAYGLDGNWRCSYSGTAPDPVSVYLARVKPGQLQDVSAWQFFTGMSGSSPSWSGTIGDKQPVLTDTRRLYPGPLLRTTAPNNGPTDFTVISQGGVVYNAPLRRYLYTSWTEYTFEFYEAPQPWGPWKLFFSHDAGGYPWFGTGSTEGGPKNGGYAATIPSKFISSDGRDMWLQSNWFVNVASGASDYNFNLRKMRLSPYQSSQPSNPADPSNNIARTGASVTPTEKSAHYGNWQYYNDGDTTQSEDSWDNSSKTSDWWGYTFDTSYHFDRVVYTTGTMFSDGGWFSSGLQVQVRQDFAWVNVTGLTISPDYPYDDTAGTNKAYTMTFDATWGDGIRIIGTPGGASTFTSIAELEAYYAG